MRVFGCGVVAGGSRSVEPRRPCVVLMCFVALIVDRRLNGELLGLTPAPGCNNRSSILK